MSNFPHTEAEALWATKEPKDQLIDSLFDRIARLQLQVIASGNASGDATERGHRVHVKSHDRQFGVEIAEYPTARKASIDEEDRLHIIGADERTIAVFNRNEWLRHELILPTDI